MRDLISRQDAVDAMNEVYCHIEMIKKRPANKTEQAIYRDMIGAVKSVPSAEPERKAGKWIPKDDARYYCSSCDGIAPKGCKWNYCPNCGADMRGKDNV